MKGIRSTVRAFAGLVVMGVALVASASQAFALRLLTPGGGAGGPVATGFSASHGTPGWEIAVIALAAAVAAALLTAGAMRTWAGGGHRLAVRRPALH